MKERMSRAVEQFAQWFEEGFAPRGEHARRVGLEKEYPAVRADTHEMADIRPIFPLLIEHIDGHLIYDDVYDDVVVGAEVEWGGHRALITTDAGYGTLEIAMDPDDSVFEAVQDRASLERLVARIMREQGIVLLGYGMQPITCPRPEFWADKGRYDLIVRSLPRGVHQVTITGADQVHVDIYRDEIVLATNVFNAITPLLLRLFANSPVHSGMEDRVGRLAVREEAWNFARERAGMPTRRFLAVDDYIDRVLDLPMYIAKTPGGYIIPNQKMPFREALIFDKQWRDQWPYHEGTIWFDARPRRIGQGTIEVRPVCSQKGPMSDALAALVLGVAENLEQINRDIVEAMSWGSWLNAKELVQLGRTLYDHHVERLLELASEGLSRRGMGEEVFLNILRQQEENPAERALRVFRDGGVSALVDEVAIDVSD